MTLTQAIAAADELRLNSVPDEQKTRWVHEIDCRVAEAMEVEIPKYTFPSDRELLMVEPHEDIYVRYLTAMIDHFNGEYEMYVNDITVFKDAFNEAMGWWRRHHRPKSSGSWRV